MLNQKLPWIYYGGDYNPDQWSEDVWKEDMRLFKLAGINLVTLPVFSWAKLQPSENEYNFEWLDKIMDLLAKNSIYCCLATSTAAQPAWMSLKYPEIMPVDIEGRKRRHGKRVNFCPNSQVYKKFAALMAEKMAERYKDHKALLLWHVANEYGTYCFCENCEKEFRIWLENKYKTTDELNKRWNLSFWNHTVYSFDEVTVPSELNDDDKFYQPKMLDYMRFMSDSSLSCYRAEYDVIKKITPYVPVSTNISGFIKKLNQFEWAKYQDVIGWDNYPSPYDDKSLVALKHSIMRGLKDGKPYLMMEQTPSQQNWQPYNTLKKPGSLRLLSYQALAHGSDSVLYFQLRQSIGGVEKLHGALISHAGHENTRVFRECAQIGNELRRFGCDTLDSVITSEVAILFDWDNWWAVELSSGPSKELKYMDMVLPYYKAFYEMNISVDIIHCESDFSKYKVIAAPLMYMIKQGVDEKLKNFVHNGGTFVTTVFSGIVDENDLVTLGGYPGKLRELLGIWVEEIDALLPQNKNSIVINKPGGELSGSYECRMLCDIVHSETADVLAVYGKDFYKNTPCLTRNQYGKGVAYYVATVPDEEFLNDFAANICKEAGIRPEIKPVRGIEVTKRVKDGNEFNFILNHNDYNESLNIGKDFYYDLITGNSFTGEIIMKPKDVLVLKKKKDYEIIKDYLTPYKYGKPVFTGSGKENTYNSHSVDCPFVFYHKDKFYMMHVGFDGKGYQTGLAVSDDLINWHEKGIILKREEHVGWDKVGAAGTWILKSNDDIYKLPTLQKVMGRYWLVYHSYPEEGYEEGPAQIGLAWSDDEELMEWHRLEQPVYSWNGGMNWENGGLYKACLIKKDDMYYMFYNAKNSNKCAWIEQIGVVMSKDMLVWERYENNPVIEADPNRWDSNFCSDPYVVSDGDKWLMFYFGFDRRNAQEGIAYSYDLLNWTKYGEPIIRYGTEDELDFKYAHKPSVLYYNGILYHFYVASRRYRQGDQAKGLWDEFRSITFATSKPLD